MVRDQFLGPLTEEEARAISPPRPVPPKAKAGGVWCGQTLYFETYDRTVEGLWVSRPGYTECADDASDEVIASLIGEALAGSEHGVPHPDFRAMGTRPIVKGCGYRYESQFIKHSKYVDLDQVDEVVTMTPNRSQGKKGFTPLGGEARCLLVAPELGLVFRRAMDAAEPYYALPSDTFRRLAEDRLVALEVKLTEQVTGGLGRRMAAVAEVDETTKTEEALAPRPASWPCSSLQVSEATVREEMPAPSSSALAAWPEVAAPSTR